MDLTNRVLIVSGALLWIFVISIIILLGWGAPDESIERLGDLAGYLDDHNNTAAKLIITFGGLILALLAVIVILYEVAPPRSGGLKVTKVGTGEARIGTDEVAHQLEQELRTMSQMSDVDVTVLGRGQKAEVNLDLHVGAGADLAATAEEACRRASQLIEERMGVALARPPRAQLHYRELRVAQPAQGPPSTGFGSLDSLPTGLDAPGPVPSEDVAATTEPTHEASETSQEDRPAGA